VNLHERIFSVVSGWIVAARLAAAKTKPLPKRIRILNWGTNNPSTSGPVSVGKLSAERLLANQRLRGAERVLIDYNHCTVEGSPEYVRRRKLGEPALVFGSGRVNLIEGSGVWLECVEWFAEGVKHARRFEDINPAFLFECGEVDFIHSVALTPNSARRKLKGD